jgi:ATP-dependent helicase/DNAse subunit B
MVAMLRNDFTFSASALDLYLACPLKFYYQHVLRLREREEVQDAVEASDVGELVHRILARYVEPLVGQRLTTDNLSVGRLEQVITACFEETFGRDATGMVLLLRRQVQDQLRRFLIDYQQRLVEREEVVVESVEQRIEVEYHGYRFTGRIDRVERRGTRIHIIDYKTGAEESKMSIRLDKLDLNDPETWGKAIPSFQLPVYMLLYSRGAQTELSSLVPQYLFLGKQTMGEEIEHGLGEDGQSPAEVLAMIEPVMLKVIENVLDPDVPFRPTREFEKHCPHCPFSTICGTQWVKGWEAG